MNKLQITERLQLLERALRMREQTLIEQIQPLPLDNTQKHARLAELKMEDRWTAKDYVGPTGALALSFDELFGIYADVGQSVANGYTLSASQEVSLALAGLMTPA